MTGKARRPLPRSRRLYTRRRPLSSATRRCGRAGVARAKNALEHHDDPGPHAPEQQLDLDLTREGPDEEASHE